MVVFFRVGFGVFRFVVLMFVGVGGVGIGDFFVEIVV